MDTLRLFIAVNIDSPELLASITNFQKGLSVKGVRLVDPQLFHFSLHFLGDTASDLIPSLQQALDTVEQAPFSVTMDHAGVFSSLRDIRVIWVGVAQGAKELSSLQKQLIQPLQELGFKIDTRAYTPHLTVGRVKFLDPENKRKVQQTVREYQTADFGRQEVTSIHLMQSTLTPQGPIYQSVYSKELIH